MNFDSRVIPDFLSIDEIAAIEECVEINRSDQNTYYDNKHESGHNAVTYSFWLDHPRYSTIGRILKPKFQTHFGPDIILGTSHVLNARVPYGIHTDVMSAGFDPDVGDQMAAWTFIIPLANFDSSTIVFKQGHERIKTLDVWIKDQNPQPHEIDDDLHQRYLSHVDRLDLQYLDVENVFPWRQGWLFATDRRKFHTSDNFPKYGVDYKKAIVIWSTVPKTHN